MRGVQERGGLVVSLFREIANGAGTNGVGRTAGGGVKFNHELKRAEAWRAQHAPPETCAAPLLPLPPPSAALHAARAVDTTTHQARMCEAGGCPAPAERATGSSPGKFGRPLFLAKMRMVLFFIFAKMRTVLILAAPSMLARKPLAKLQVCTQMCRNPRPKPRVAI